MRAVHYEQAGGPEVLRTVDRPLPEPGPGEVRVRIAFSAVNPSDWKARRTTAPGPEGQIPHQDGAGTVEAVGQGVGTALVGERVWVWEAARKRPFGTAAEYTVVPARQVVVLGAGSPLELGAALGIPFLTAHRCLTLGEAVPDRLGAGSLTGRTVLVQGGAGVVGNAAVQLASWAGATVIATVSGPRKAQLAAAAGASHVVDYRRQDVVEEVRRIAPRGVDVVVEVAASANAGIDAQVVGRYGAVAMYAGDSGAQVCIPLRSQIAPNARWQFVGVYTEPARAKEVGVEDVATAVADGAVRVGEDAGLPLHVFPLERTADAHRAVEQRVVGKVLVDVTA